MGMLDDDLAAIHTDALALGMADSVTYTHASGSPAPHTITGTFMELAQPFIHAEASEVHRRICQFDCRRSLITTPAKGDTVTVASGAYTGVWTVTDTGTGDEGDWLLTVRMDDRTKAGTGRKLPT